MSDAVIRAEGLSKRYRIGARRESYATLRESIVSVARRIVTAPVRAAARLGRGAPRSEFIWALKDVSFEVKRGEVLGIIGPNGAGKTTLLKVLSRITEPTEGTAEIRGRVGALLEVGTGFHPELTGRENVYLNGAILGMRRREIRAKFDEIVAFAEIERFIDTPVKRYSSGMQTRLAFAVAAHLEPEVLLVDEVLAVGDASFQRKCLGKMGEVAGAGRTVLFVSHNMAAIEALCGQALFMDGGTIGSRGEAGAVVETYLAGIRDGSATLASTESASGDFRIERIVLRDDGGRPTGVFRPGESISIDVHYVAREPVPRPYLWIGISGGGGCVFGASMLMDGFRPDSLEGRGRIRCTFKRPPLLPRQTYVVRLGGRRADGRSFLFRSLDVAHFAIAGCAADAGLKGELADKLLQSSTFVLLPYVWELPDGRTLHVDGVPARGKDTRNLQEI